MAEASGVLALEQARLIVEQDDLDPETLECLGQLASNRPAPNHRQPARGSVRVKTVSLVSGAASASPGMGGIAGRPPVAMTARAKRSRWLADENRFPVDESRVAEEHVHAEALEPARRVVRGDGRPRSAHARHRFGERHMQRGRR